MHAGPTIHRITSKGRKPRVPETKIRRDYCRSATQIRMQQFEILIPRRPRPEQLDLEGQSTMLTFMAVLIGQIQMKAACQSLQATGGIPLVVVVWELGEVPVANQRESLTLSLVYVAHCVYIKMRMPPPAPQQWKYLSFCLEPD
jgi:hypothetical protein